MEFPKRLHSIYRTRPTARVDMYIKKCSIAKEFNFKYVCLCRWVGVDGVDADMARDDLTPEKTTPQFLYLCCLTLKHNS